MDDYKIIVEQEHQTVMAHYEVGAKPDVYDRYQVSVIFLAATFCSYDDAKDVLKYFETKENNWKL